MRQETSDTGQNQKMTDYPLRGQAFVRNRQIERINPGSKPWLRPKSAHTLELHVKYEMMYGQSPMQQRI